MANLSSKYSGFVCDRETQLRREIVATMRLRAMWRNLSRRQLAPNRTSEGNLNAARPTPPPHAVRQGGGDPVPGEHITRILLISDYDGLRISSERLLRKNGYEVESMTSRACLDATDLPVFDIAVLCQSVECNRVLLLSYVLRHFNPNCCLLRVASLVASMETGFDLRVDGLGGPAAFLAAVDTLVHRPRKTA